jgi:hypothetical protein
MHIKEFNNPRLSKKKKLSPLPTRIDNASEMTSKDTSAESNEPCNVQ